MWLGLRNNVSSLAGNLDQQVVDILVVDSFGHFTDGLRGHGELESVAESGEGGSYAGERGSELFHCYASWRGREIRGEGIKEWN
jgi:hypothetical protein